MQKQSVSDLEMNTDTNCDEEKHEPRCAKWKGNPSAAYKKCPAYGAQIWHHMAEPYLSLRRALVSKQTDSYHIVPPFKMAWRLCVKMKNNTSHIDFPLPGYNIRNDKGETKGVSPQLLKDK